MPSAPTSLADEIGIAIGNLADAATGMVTPTLRVGVTGLSGAGKTIFITALVHALVAGGRLPGFGAMAEGRLIGAKLAEYPEAAIPRFGYEQHLEALTGSEPHWPESTRRISQLRLTLRYRGTSWYSGFTGPSHLNLDIVDYPGEWLLDLSLLPLGFAEWSEAALELARRPSRAAEAGGFLAALAAADLEAEATEPAAEALAHAFTDYLRKSRDDARALSSLPPGRFLLPGDLEGSPALTFAPLPRPERPVRGKSLYAMLERRYEAYKDLVVRPFFRDHFARLDRQIVLVDALRPLNAGPEAVADLETALTDVLAAFRQGENSLLGRLVARRIDRILFAASKADHLHSSAHDRLEAILNRLLARARQRARFAGAETRSLALAAIRATREGTIEDHGARVGVVIGTPEAGERLDGTVYDGKTEIALFPGDLPEDPDAVFRPDERVHLRFLRFRPPKLSAQGQSGAPVLPHIRLDRALDYLVGDRLR